MEVVGFKEKKSTWTQKFHKLHPEAKTLKQISDVTGIPKPALSAVKSDQSDLELILKKFSVGRDMELLFSLRKGDLFWTVIMTPPN